MIKYILLNIASTLTILLPLRGAYIIGYISAFLYYFIKRGERNNIKKNLRVVYAYKGESYSENKLNAMTWVVFKNFSRYLVDFLRLPSLSKDDLQKMVTIHNKHYLEEAYAHKKGVIALTAHLGNWELSGYIVAYEGYPVKVVALPHENTAVNSFFSQRRKAGGVLDIPVGMGGFSYLEVLKKNNIVGLVGDRLTSDAGMTADFFGKPTQVPRGPVILSMRSGAPIVPAFIIRKADNEFEFTYEKPIYPENFRKGNRIDTHAFCRAVLEQVEKYILQAPEQWFVFTSIWE